MSLPSEVPFIDYVNAVLAELGLVRKADAPDNTPIMDYIASCQEHEVSAADCARDLTNEYNEQYKKRRG